jgi:hypothetical protein
MNARDEIDRCLSAAEAVAPEQWTLVYERYANQKSIHRAIVKLYDAATMVSLARHRALPVETKDKRDPEVLAEVGRIEKIASHLSEESLDERGGQFRQRIEWLLVKTRFYIETADAWKADARTRKAYSTLE